MSNKTIMIDFDGVIHTSSQGYRNGEIYDPPTFNSVFTLHNLRKAGYELVVLTARDESEWETVKEWLRDNGFPDMEVTNIKRKALAYIDDRAIRFTSWNDICHYFL